MFDLSSYIATSNTVEMAAVNVRAKPSPLAIEDADESDDEPDSQTPSEATVKVASRHWALPSRRALSYVTPSDPHTGIYFLRVQSTEQPEADEGEEDDGRL